MSRIEEFLRKEQISKVKGKDGRIYEIKECIGEGGQGAVFKTQHPNLLVKLSVKKSDSIKEIEATYHRYANLRSRQDAPKNMAKPLAELIIIQVKKNDKEALLYGYVMELMEDMIPLSETFRKKNEDPIAFIKRFGGIKRMYTILRKLAETLDEVHSAGFCYGDLNPNNVFISKDLDYTEVQLIDCDNMVFAADFDGRIYYPGYGAPELIKNQTNNMMTDTWSFAVLAFYLLRQELPFNGKMIQDAKTEKISIMEAKQNASELPWIDDPSGENENSSALPKEAMFRNPIYNLFDRTFGNDHNCYSRPILQEWIKELRKAEGAFFICGNSECQMTYLVQKSRTCPFCESKVPREYLIIVASQKFSAIDTDTKNIVKISIVKNKESKTVLNDRDVFTHIFWTGNKNIVASVTLSNQKAAIKFSEDIDISVYVNNEKKGIGQFKKDNERKLSLEKGKTYSLELPSFKPNYDFFYTDTESINTDSNTLKYNCTNVINFKLAE